VEYNFVQPTNMFGKLTVKDTQFVVRLLTGLNGNALDPISLQLLLMVVHQTCAFNVIVSPIIDCLKQ
jgi:hypothetical protein